MDTLEIGQVAPDFTAPVIGGKYQNETNLTLSELKGEPVVLIFYPKDDTPGCTTQACELRDSWSEVQSKAQIFGVSIDSIASHQKFLEKYELPYPLLSDEKKEIVEAYQVWVEKSMYGKKYFGTERSTFVIAADGTIQSILRKVAPKKHLALLLKALEG